MPLSAIDAKSFISVRHWYVFIFWTRTDGNSQELAYSVLEDGQG